MASQVNISNDKNDNTVNVWKKGNQLIAFASGGAFLGGLLLKYQGLLLVL